MAPKEQRALHRPMDLHAITTGKDVSGILMSKKGQDTCKGLAYTPVRVKGRVAYNTTDQSSSAADTGH